MKAILPLSFVLIAVAALAPAAPQTQPSRYFVIQVIDDQTARGVPLVELRTVAGQRFYTDSLGLAAIDEPALMGRKVFFNVQSHGYEYPADGFGIRGKAMDVRAGGEVTLKIKRLNIAERLYRATGEGIYRDAVLAGRTAPIKQPLLNAQVTGQDSVQPAVYRGKIYWFWGDTNRISYPLGHFGTAGATSLLPSGGGLRPEVGIDLDYFANPEGFSRPMCNVPGEGMKWIDGVVVVKDQSGQDRLVAGYARMKSLGEAMERGLLAYDDAKDLLQPVARFDIHERLRPDGQAFVSDGWCYYATAYPVIRVRAELEAMKDRAQYEAFTCLSASSRYDKSSPKLDRDADGKLIWAWKKNTEPVMQKEQEELLRAGRIKPGEIWFDMKDARGGKSVRIHAGSVFFNEFRKRFVMIAGESGGKSSFLGEIWYSEAARPEGPWRKAVKIVTHDRYSFYNPVHHPFFDENGGRTIYFEGTYTTTFSRDNDATPLYDYNQIMYRMDLGDARLSVE